MTTSEALPVWTVELSIWAAGDKQGLLIGFARRCLMAELFAPSGQMEMLLGLLKWAIERRLAGSTTERA